jgi:hypothetical protein
MARTVKPGLMARMAATAWTAKTVKMASTAMMATTAFLSSARRSTLTALWS